MCWPAAAEVRLTAPLPLAAVAFWETWLPIRLAVLSDDPAPPMALVVALMVLVFVVVWLSVPPPTTESLRAAWMLFAVLVVLVVVVVLVLLVVLVVLVVVALVVLALVAL